MSEIEKMYRNAEIKMQHLLDINTNYFVDTYPPFTSKKQVELIKWLARNEMLCRLEDEYSYFERFEECIAYIINYLWQDLTDVERKQIKEILE